MRYYLSPADGTSFWQRTLRQIKWHRWLPGAASQFHSLVENFFTSVTRLGPRLHSDVLATQPSPLFHVVDGGYIVTNVSIFGSINGEVATHIDTVVYVLPSSAYISQPSLVFMPSEWLYKHSVEHLWG